MSITAEKVLEETIQETEGDVMYFWAHLDMDGGFTGNNNDVLTFWSMCDILNGGHCRYIVVNIIHETVILLYMAISHIGCFSYVVACLCLSCCIVFKQHNASNCYSCAFDGFCPCLSTALLWTEGVVVARSM